MRSTFATPRRCTPNQERNSRTVAGLTACPLANASLTLSSSFGINVSPSLLGDLYGGFLERYGSRKSPVLLLTRTAQDPSLALDDRYAVQSEPVDAAQGEPPMSPLLAPAWQNFAAPKGPHPKRPPNPLTTQTED